MVLKDYDFLNKFIFLKSVFIYSCCYLEVSPKSDCDIYLSYAILIFSLGEMCILFLHTEETSEPNKYKLILASNRDESYSRPAKPAHYWKENDNVFGGRDMEPGREGGTWLAMSTTGKIGVLLNILMPTAAPSPAGRGFLVANYVMGPVSSGTEYLNNIKNDGNQYNHFNMITIEIRDDVKVSHYSNATSEKPETLPIGTFGFGNSAFDEPFLKVVEGKKSFESIIKKHGTTEHKEMLIEELISFLKCDKSYFPDERMLKMVPNISEEKHRMYSSLYVKSPSVKYGTRTHTVILVDQENQVDFVEWTMEEPIESLNPKWIKHATSFKLKLANFDK